MVSVVLALFPTISTPDTANPQWQDVDLEETVGKVVKSAGFVQSNDLIVVMTRHDDGSIYTNFIGKVVQDIGSAMDLSPIELTPTQ